VLVVEEEIL